MSEKFVSDKDLVELAGYHAYMKYSDEDQIIVNDTIYEEYVYRLR
ncbi:hypothetical protein [Gracilibacillus saliphilus]|nr:hypothetical protein [Gracilibacillus saliphilus]